MLSGVLDNKRTRGFTIVELLIVIVVIGILATITIIAYSGVTNNANIASARSAALDSAKKVLAYMALNNDQVPPDLTTAGINASGNTTFQYSFNNAVQPQTFCITATTANQSFFINNNTQTIPASGGCPGHGVGGQAAIVNLAPNPSIESSTSSWLPANSATLATSGAQARTGSSSLLVTLPASASAGTVGAGVYINSPIPTIFAPSTSYMFSAYVYVPPGTVDIRVAEQGAGVATKDFLSSNTTSAKNSWTRINDSFTTAASGVVSLYVLNTTATGGTTTQFYIDDVMITQTKTLYNYADPLSNPSSWVWNGAANNSLSTGPAV